MQSNSGAPLSLEQRRGDLAALRTTVLNDHSQAFDYNKFGAEPRPSSQFSDAPGKTMAQMDPRRSRDFSRPASVASAASVEIHVSDVSHQWRGVVTPRSNADSGAAHLHTPQGRDRSRPLSMSSQATGITDMRSVSHAPPPPSVPTGSPAAPRAVPDGFAIQLDKLPQEGRKFVLKSEEVRQGAALAPPSPSHSWGPAEEALQRNDSAMGGGSLSARATPNGRPKKSPSSALALDLNPPPPGATHLDSPQRTLSSARATPNGRPKKLPSSGRGNPPAPDTPRVGPPLSNAGWGSINKQPDLYDSRASSRASGDDDTMSDTSMSSIGSSVSGMGRGRGRGRASSSSSTPLPPAPPAGVAPPHAGVPGAAAPATPRETPPSLTEMMPLPPAPGNAPLPPGGRGSSSGNRPLPPSGPPAPIGGPVRPRSKPK